MDVPTTGFAVVAVIVLAVPGFVYAGVRRWAVGERAADRDVGLSIARGIVFAAALASVYAIAAGPLITGSVSISSSGAVSIVNVRLSGLLVLGLFVIVPLAISAFAHRDAIEWHASNPGRPWLRLPRSKAGVSTTPSAWDFATIRNQASWI